MEELACKRSRMSAKRKSTESLANKPPMQTKNPQPRTVPPEKDIIRTARDLDIGFGD